MASTRRQFVGGIASTALIPAGAASATGDTVTPEMFGAKGDGVTNDTLAFAAMSAHVNARGGGVIALRPVTYLVGLQKPWIKGPRISFMPVDIVRLKRCTRPVQVRGNGARLKAAPGLRYGRFDPASGEPLPLPPKRQSDHQAAPYWGMISIIDCSDLVEISDVELDGNVQQLRIGGKYGRQGWEAGGSGIELVGNRGPERLSHIHSHHHPADGLILAPAIDRTGSTIVTDVIGELNGRQGCSITGGRNFVFERCKFRYTGKAGIRSAPGDGVDIEPEARRIQNLTFLECEFVANAGFGVGTGRARAAEIRFTNCKFVATNNYAGWLETPRMRFGNCLFVGAVSHVYGDPDPAEAAQFSDCTFTDDPRLSPTGKVSLGPEGTKSIAVMRHRRNVRFTRCRFRLVAEAVLPLSGNEVIYEDCTMSQHSPARSTPAGTYIGTSSITGNADLEGSIVHGKVTLNGRVLPRTA